MNKQTHTGLRDTAADWAEHNPEQIFTLQGHTEQGWKMRHPPHDLSDGWTPVCGVEAAKVCLRLAAPAIFAVALALSIWL